MRSIYFCLVCWFSIITTFFILCSNLIFLPILLAQGLSPPTVSTGEATDVTSSSATLNGTSSSQRVPNAWFEYGAVSGSYDNSVSAVVTFGVSKNVWKASINGLSPATIYYYRIAANDSYPGYTTDTAYGSEKSFTTLAATPTATATPTPQAPTVVTTDLGGITFLEYYEADGKYIATLTGKVIPNGLSTTAWFEYGTSSGSYSNTSATKDVGDGFSYEEVSIKIEGNLQNESGNNYYRLIAQNSAGISYGSEASFFTYSATELPLTLTTEDAAEVTSNSAVLNGAVNFKTDYALNSTQFKYGTLSSSYTMIADAEVYGSVTGWLSTAHITGLSPSTTYYYRLKALEKFITWYGDEKSFTTLPQCEAKEMTIFPRKPRLKIGKSGEITVTLGGDDCVPAGNTVTATTSKIGSKRIWVTPASQATNENGEAVFTITAMKIGNIRVTFKVDSLRKSLTVKVKR